MLLEILLAAVADAVFAILVDNLSKQPKLIFLREKLSGDSPEKVAFQRALSNAYLTFKQIYPDLVASFFDESFLNNNNVIKELAKSLIPNQDPNPEVISAIWNSQFSHHIQYDLIIPSSYFIKELQYFIKAEPNLKPFIDSRALEQLYSLSNSVQDQVAIQRDIKNILSDIHLLLTKQQEEEIHSNSSHTESCSEGSLNQPSFSKPSLGRESMALSSQSTVINKLIDFLSNIPMFDTVSNRRALILRAGLDINLLRQIEFDGSTVSFITNLIDKCDSYGQLKDGREALEALLDSTKTLIGLDKQKTLQNLLHEWKAKKNKKSKTILSESSYPSNDRAHNTNSEIECSGLTSGNEQYNMESSNIKNNNFIGISVSTRKIILIVTATKIETQSVLKTFTREGNWIRSTLGSKTYFQLGVHGGVPVFMVQSEMGTATPGGSLLTIRQAIQDLQPQAVIMCGIAFGLRPGKQQMGDILISKQIEYYEPIKIDSSKGKLTRSDRTTAANRLLDRFRSGDIDWQGAQTHFGLILSGEKLVNDSTFHDWLLEFEPEAIGGEMEGAGLYVAARDANIDWILVKAICDWADGTKNSDFQIQAANNAAEFLLHVIKLGGWE